jgi:hypothetical protein
MACFRQFTGYRRSRPRKICRMNNPARTVLLVLVAMIAGTAAQTRDSGSGRSKDLVGGWDSMVRLADGKGQTLQFSSDGSFAELWDYERQGTYRLKDSQISISTWSDKERRQMKRSFETVQNGQQLALKEAQGEEIRLTPVCKGATGIGIVREWFSENFPGALPVIRLETLLRFPVFVEFTKDGDVYFRSVPINSTKGSYELSGKKLVLKRDGMAPLELKPRISSKRLDIRIFGSNTPEVFFRRIESSQCDASDTPST